MFTEARRSGCGAHDLVNVAETRTPDLAARSSGVLAGKHGTRLPRHGRKDRIRGFDTHCVKDALTFDNIGREGRVESRGKANQNKRPRGGTISTH